MAQGLPLFSEAGLTGPVLYLDLDTVVCGDLENLAALASGTRFATLGTAAMRNENRDHGYNSSVMAWTAPLYSEIWTLLDEDGAYEVITNCVSTSSTTGSRWLLKMRVSSTAASRSARR